MKKFWLVAISFVLATTVMAESESYPPTNKKKTAEPHKERRSEETTSTKAVTKKAKPKPTKLTKMDTPKLPNPPTKSDLAHIIKTQSLRVCVRSDVPPFGYFASQGLIGFDIQLAKQLAMQLSIYYKKNIQINWQVIEAGERISRLQRKKCDIVAASFSYTAKRAKQISFSNIYLETDKVAIASSAIQRSTPIIALVKGTTNETKDLKGTVRYFSNYKEIIHAMKGGEVDYVVTDRPIAMHMMRSVTKSFRLHKTFSQRERYGLGMNKQSKHLLRAINRALKDLGKTGRLAYLYRQWL